MTRDTSRGRAKVRQVCAAFGISTQAYHKAKKAATPDDGEGGKPRKERRGPWASAAELEVGIRRVVATHPGWGSRKVWARLKREGVVASKNRVWAMMRALGLVLPPVNEREPTVRRGQVVVADSNRRWASDLTTAWTSRDGWAAIVPVIDCGDRYGLACDVMKSQEAPMVLSPVARSLTVEFGSSTNVPWDLELRTDHGPQYTGNDCEALCKQWNVTHTLAPVGRPTGNAVAERFIQTLKVELIWTRDWESIAELRAAIEAWLTEYNHGRPHQSLGWETPAERRAKNLAVRAAA
jgi:putative transposase